MKKNLIRDWSIIILWTALCFFIGGYAGKLNCPPCDQGVETVNEYGEPPYPVEALERWGQDYPRKFIGEPDTIQLLIQIIKQRYEQKFDTLIWEVYTDGRYGLVTATGYDIQYDTVILDTCYRLDECEGGK